MHPMSQYYILEWKNVWSTSLLLHRKPKISITRMYWRTMQLRIFCFWSRMCVHPNKVKIRFFSLLIGTPSLFHTNLNVLSTTGDVPTRLCIKNVFPFQYVALWLRIWLDTIKDMSSGSMLLAVQLPSLRLRFERNYHQCCSHFSRIEKQSSQNWSYVAVVWSLPSFRLRVDCCLF